MLESNARSPELLTDWTEAEGPLAGGKYGRLDADQRVVPRDKKAIWRQKTKSRDNNFCVAALIYASAITPEEGDMTKDDADDLVANKDYKEMIKAFVEIGDMIRENFIESANRGLVDDDDDNEDDFEGWMSNRLAAGAKFSAGILNTTPDSTRRRRRPIRNASWFMPCLPNW